jgi:hypothetical protein
VMASGRRSSLFDNWGPAAEDYGRVAVVGEGLGVLGNGELLRYRIRYFPFRRKPSS